ncbi:hypothetical protein GOEFS_036_01350 [Gordonia effusa NBRC 100432]|uniref:Pilus assembly protein TadE n=1 Tax=Gordonia effusa NBRC 100432 TaxID=1077974 RepID=H0QXZ5_9ACTN|nr:TadE family type IV pilus minor pilin [Gordonia effusa]GAB17696.1 hypothetical protein GOEFS_036_01350 [Gordonia effusa NBRC 100432]
MRARRLHDDDAGMSTVESAYAIAAIVAVLILGIVGVSTVSAQVRCVDAAREVARLIAAGDATARDTGARVAPTGATISVNDSSPEYVEVTVETTVALLPGLDIRARAVAAREPDAGQSSNDDPDAPPDR